MAGGASILKKRKQRKQKKTILNFYVSCATIAEDRVIELREFLDFLKANIKVNGKKGNLGKQVSVTEDTGPNGTSRVKITAEAPFSKRYIKYLTRKYLKKIEIKDYVHISASNTSRVTYDLKYYKVPDAEE